jgi:hypothetical protein
MITKGGASIVFKTAGQIVSIIGFIFGLSLTSKIITGNVISTINLELTNTLGSLLITLCSFGAFFFFRKK